MATPEDIPRPEATAHGFVAFVGQVRLGAGTLSDVAAAARRAVDENPNAAVVVFNRETAEVVDLDLRGSEEEVLARHRPAETPPTRRGRPRLGVVAREVTLLPRHWDWLARQPGGASTTLRRLVEAARKTDAGLRRARTEAAYRFMSVVAGNLAGFEEATRALFAGDRDRLANWLAKWPSDIGDEVWAFLGDDPVG
jgi:uncharacterized protein